MARLTKLDEAIRDLTYKRDVLNLAIAQLEAQKAAQPAKPQKPRETA